MSPLLFWLSVEGVSLLIGEAKDQGMLLGIKFSPTLAITHIFFVDDVVLFGQGTYEEWRCYKSIITLFSIASVMMISLVKSSFLCNNLKDELVVWIRYIFPYKMESID